MRMFSAATMRGLVAGLLVLGIIFGLVLSQVVPPVVAGVGVGAREVANRVATLGAQPAAAQLSPAQPAQIQFNQVSWPDIVEKVGPAVVTVVSETAAPRTPRGFGTPMQPMQPAQALGSGVIVDERGYVVTNNHVVAEGQKYQVILADGKKVSARLVGRDDYSDLAVLQIEGPLPAVASLGDSGRLRAGEPVIAIGSPLGDFRNTVTSGVVSATGRKLDDSAPGLTDLIQTDAPINSGNSGGPLVNAAGQVVGINTAVVRGAGAGGLFGAGGSASAEGLGFAVPASTVRTVVDQLITSGVVARPYLGINYQTINPRIAAYYDLEAKEGALVARVGPNSPARQAGLQQGDVITAVDGEKVGEQKSLAEILNKRKVGDEVTLTITRDGKEQTLAVKLGQRPTPDSN
jgi:S1-C subfamily serine protease